jgi:hypothetical protein
MENEQLPEPCLQRPAGIQKHPRQSDYLARIFICFTPGQAGTGRRKGNLVCSHRMMMVG